MRPDGDTIAMIVRQGEAQIATPQGSTEVRTGEMATVRGNAADSAQYKISPAPDRDDWDRWNSDRDHIIRDAGSWRHTNRRYTGTPRISMPTGNWQNVPDYGDVWVSERAGAIGLLIGTATGCTEALLRMDVGRLRAHGDEAPLSLWTLVLVWPFVGVVAGSGICRL